MFKAKLADFVALDADGNVALNPSILALDKAKGVPVSVAWDVSTMVDTYAEHVQRYAKKRFELIKEHGEEVEPDRWQVTPEKLPAFVEAHQALLDIEVEIPVDKIKRSVLGDKVEGVTAADIRVCRFMLENDRVAG